LAETAAISVKVFPSELMRSERDPRFLSGKTVSQRIPRSEKRYRTTPASGLLAEAYSFFGMRPAKNA